MKKKYRIYADTSVFGGIMDTEFFKTSIEFFEEVKIKRFELYTSLIVEEELAGAPQEIRDFYHSFLPIMNVVPITQEAALLQKAYLDAKIVSENYDDDALHVALASIAECDCIISWNFKHIVHFQKIPFYNAVNTLHGYKPIGIFSPLEVIHYEEGF